jgi:hypothetical protein
VLKFIISFVINPSSANLIRIIRTKYLNMNMIFDIRLIVWNYIFRLMNFKQVKEFGKRLNVHLNNV